jgi:hypothetical protein
MVVVLVVLHQQAPEAPEAPEVLPLVWQDRQETVAVVVAAVGLEHQVVVVEQEEVVQDKRHRMEKPEISTETAVEEEVLPLFQIFTPAGAPALQVQ